MTIDEDVAAACPHATAALGENELPRLGGLRSIHTPERIALVGASGYAGVQAQIR